MKYFYYNIIRLFLILLLFPMIINADIIYLKNGKQIETSYAWEDNGLIKCYRFGAVISYTKADVEKIEKSEFTTQDLFPVVRNDESQELPLSSADEQKHFTQEDKNSGSLFKVIQVYDGDTFKASGHNIDIKVRLAGIDAPEMGNKKKQKSAQPYCRKAKAYLEKMVLNKTVFLKGYGIGQYNRQIAEVFIENKNINLEMIKAGLAEVYQGRPPKGFDVMPYQKAEAVARERRKGIWQLRDSYVSPRIWRKK